MDRKQLSKACADPTEEIVLQLPCRIAERIQTYASKNNTSLTNVVIEALDVFLRSRKSGSM